MSVALVNRSLAIVRAELKFVAESEAITNDLLRKILQIIPSSYSSGMVPWGLEKLDPGNSPVKLIAERIPDDPFREVGGGKNSSSRRVPPPQVQTERETEFDFKGSPTNAPAPQSQPASKSLSNGSDAAREISKTKSKSPDTSPVKQQRHTKVDPGDSYVAPIRAVSSPVALPAPIGFCQAYYDYKAERAEDISLQRAEKIVITEQLSSDWYKGYKKNQKFPVLGVFPAGAVALITEGHFLDPNSDFRPDPPAEPVLSVKPPKKPPSPELVDRSPAAENEVVHFPGETQRGPQTQHSNPPGQQQDQLSKGAAQFEGYDKNKSVPRQPDVSQSATKFNQSDTLEDSKALPEPVFVDPYRGAKKYRLPIQDGVPYNPPRSQDPKGEGTYREVAGFHLVQPQNPSTEPLQPSQAVNEFEDSGKPHKKRLSFYSSKPQGPPPQAVSGQQMRQFSNPEPKKAEKRESHFKLFGKKSKSET